MIGKMVSIGRRLPVQDIRTVWPKETEFSDWLVTADGLALLAQDLEIIIENPRREVKGVDFSCDVVANVVGDENQVVVIENQFGRTNHDHLAKLLTYAATQKAIIGVWIAEEVADDHRQVIDWLNENTPGTVALYLATLNAYTIGGSPPAPQLDVVCRPNTTMKQSNAAIPESEKIRRERRITFWRDIHDHMKKEKLPFQLQRPGPDHWSSISIGRSGFHINMLLTPKNGSVAVELNIHPDGWKEAAFSELQKYAEQIEGTIGRKLDWRPMPDKASARIVLEEQIDPDVEANRSKVCDWFAEWTPKIYLAFRDQVKALEAEPNN